MSCFEHWSIRSPPLPRGSLTTDGELCTDPRSVKVVMLDLLSNAIAYSRRNGVVTIVSQIRDENVRVSMSDTGSGFSPLLLEQLFTPVTQRDLAPSTSRDVGLELTRSRLLMEGLGAPCALSPPSVMA